MINAQRHILHIDMDAFYAAVEQHDNPALRGRPVLVGGSPEGRGVVSAASYEARPFGCRSALPMAEAIHRCPHAVVVRPRMERYLEISRQVFEIIEHYTPIVEPLSIDEAFLDITGSTRLFGPPPQIAAEMKRRIHDHTGLTASVGVAPNKFLAKLASDLRKPDGLVIVPADRVQEFLDPLPVSRLWGAGKITQKHLESLDLHSFGDVRRHSLEQLETDLGEMGGHFYHLVRGDDDRPVVPDRDAKSISHENTFAMDVSDAESLRAVLLAHTERVAARLRRHERLARTVTIKVRTSDFKTYTRSTTLSAPTDRTDVIWKAASELFDTWLDRRPRPVRLIGVGVSHLTASTGRQLSLFEQTGEARGRALDQAIDEVRARYGRDALVRGPNVHPSE